MVMVTNHHGPQPGGDQAEAADPGMTKGAMAAGWNAPGARRKLLHGLLLCRTSGCPDGVENGAG
ncbi:MAG: hypothetical protein CMJ48_04850 [Planctomycetaceae bacterium]|nr:hypothetical protein [Planctomycetaceae bacterium]